TGAGAGSVGAITFTAMQYLTGGAGNDTFAFGVGSSIAGKIDGGAGTNTLDDTHIGHGMLVNLQTHFLSSTGGFANMQAVVGASAARNNTLIGFPAATPFRSTGAGAGSVGAITFTAMQYLTGGAGNDTFAFGAGSSIA